jgi:hypothetical protein
MGSVGAKIMGADQKAATAEFSDGGYKKMYGDDAIHNKDFTNQVGNYIKQNQEKMVNGIGEQDIQNQMNTVQGNTNPVMQDLANKYGVEGANNNVFSGENYDSMLNGQLNAGTENLYNQANVNRANYGMANDQMTQVAGMKNNTSIANAKAETNASLANNAAIGGFTLGAIQKAKQAALAVATGGASLAAGGAAGAAGGHVRQDALPGRGAP